MRTVLLALAFAAVLSAADKPRVTRDVLAGVERSMDIGIRSLDVNQPYDLLGFSRGVYLPGYGAVFTAEVNLVVTIITPFNPPPTGQKRIELRLRKEKRLVVVRDWMRRALVDAGAALDQVPPDERVVFAMTLFYQSFEDRTGLPGQIVMQAPRQALADFKAGRIGPAQLDSAIQFWEL
jgi:hypothetical protein